MRAGSAPARGALARVRLNRLKVAAGGCGGCGPMAMGIESFFVCNVLILHGLGKTEKAKIAVKSVMVRHDFVEQSTRSVRRPRLGSNGQSGSYSKDQQGTALGEENSY